MLLVGKPQQLNAEKMRDSTSVNFEKLTKDNYRTWRMHAEALLVDADLWDYVKENKEITSLDADRRELWMKQDKKAKSKLILHISSALLPLVGNCTTSREVWSKLDNIYGNKGEEQEDSIGNSDTEDEDEIINDIEISVADFFKTIDDQLSGHKIIDYKKSLSITFTDNLFSQLKINGVKKLPDKTIIVKTVSDFIDHIGKLFKLEIRDRKDELSNELIDNLLVKFNINPHKNENDESKSEADAAEIQDNVTASGGKKDLPFLRESYEGVSGREIAPLLDLYTPPLVLYTPPSTPTIKTPRKCGICRKEGHNRTTCPLNKPVASAEIRKNILSPRIAANNPESPARSYKCGICREEGHNRTSCPLNKPAVSVSKSTVVATETPKRSYKCGGCGREGHNIRSCPSISSAISSPKPAADRTPVRSYTCGLCGGEGHNRTTCPRNYVTPAAPTRAANKCGNCGGEGHNSRTCGRRQTSSSFYDAAPSYSYSSYAPSYSYSSPARSSGGGGGGGRSYTCSNCGGSGHNRRTCTG